MNLGIGVFVTETGQPYVMPSVRQAIQTFTNDNFNYTPTSGDPAFLKGCTDLVLGDAIDPTRFVVQATNGGTHACSLFAELAKRAGYEEILIPEPTWGNHKQIFSGFTQTVFPHLNAQGQADVEAYRNTLLSVTRPTVLLLHGGPTHNPTGINLSLEQVRSLLDVIRSRPVFVYIDFAYLGLGDGLEKDAEIPRLLLQELEGVAVGVSFSKNATLYQHRTGVLMVKTDDVEIVQSNVRQLVRSTISSAPAFGQYVMATIWRLFPQEWIRDVNTMREQIDERKKRFIEQTPSFHSLKNTRGLFGILPVSEEEIQQLRESFGVHLLPGGRINFGGIETNRIEYLAQAFTSCRSTQAMLRN